MHNGYIKVDRIIKYIVLYLAFTFIFYFIGPIRWQTPDSILLFLYVSLIFIALYLGYRFFLYRHKIIKNSNFEIEVDNSYFISDELLINWLKFMLPIYLVIMTLYMFRNLGNTSFSFNNIIFWITNPSAQYAAKFNVSVGVFGKIVAVSATFFSMFLWATIPLGLFFFKKLSLLFKILVVLDCIVELLRWLGMGTNKGIIDFILIVICLTYAYRSRDKRKISKKTKYSLIAVLFVILGLMYFGNNISGRVSGNDLYLMNGLYGNRLDYNNFFYKYFPHLRSLILYMDSYFTQGYYGLSLGMQKGFVPMFGVGNSVFLTENIQEIFGVNLTELTYINRIDPRLWSSSSNWHTAFLWFANDYSIYGVPVVVFVLGYYFGFITDQLFIKKNNYFFPLFCMMIQMFFYFPMNNQILSSPFSFMGFFGMNLFAFLLKHGSIRPVRFVFGSKRNTCSDK